MTRIYTLLIGLLLTTTITAQNYDNVLNYNLNGTPTHGVKITTNLPYTNSSQMPTVKIEGYAYGLSKTIDVTLVWYIYAGNFYALKASSAGGFAPKIKLANENGKVVIFIDERVYYQRFTVSAYAKGMSETAFWFTGWTAADQALAGTNHADVSYYNEMGTLELSGDLNIDVGSNHGGMHISAGNAKNAYMNFVEKNTDGSPDYGGGLYYDGAANALKLTTYSSSKPLLLNTTGGANVGIGTITPTEKLSVDGTVLAKKFRASVSSSDWPDYVFGTSYELQSLEELQSFIKENGHLPNIPKAEDVERSGQDLGEIQKRLLEKIEELTLYTLDQEAQLKQVKKEKESLKQVVEQLLRRVESLEKGQRPKN